MKNRFNNRGSHVSHSGPDGTAYKGQRSKKLSRVEELLELLDSCTITVEEKRELSGLMVELKLDFENPTFVEVSIFGTFKQVAFEVYIERYKPQGFEIKRRIFR